MNGKTNSLHLIILAVIVIAALIIASVFIPKSQDKPYIPSESTLGGDYAVLNLNDAIVFKLENGSFGYLYFTSINKKREAYYRMAIFKKYDYRVNKIAEISNGRVATKEGQRWIKCDNVSIIWLWPTNIDMLAEWMQYAAIIPISDLHLISEGKLEQIKWHLVEGAKA
jgi:hypothetical protein